jgi:hypothetical protein
MELTPTNSVTHVSNGGNCPLTASHDVQWIETAREIRRRGNGRAANSKKVLKYLRDVTAGRTYGHKLRGAASGQCKILGDIRDINRMDLGEEVEKRVNR